MANKSVITNLSFSSLKSGLSKCPNFFIYLGNFAEELNLCRVERNLWKCCKEHSTEYCPSSQISIFWTYIFTGHKTKSYRFGLGLDLESGIVWMWSYALTLNKIFHNYYTLIGWLANTSPYICLLFCLCWLINAASAEHMVRSRSLFQSFLRALLGITEESGKTYNPTFTILAIRCSHHCAV